MLQIESQFSLSLVSVKCGKPSQNSIVYYLKAASTLNDANHGFVRRCSCSTNLMLTEEPVTGMADLGKLKDVVRQDLPKEFDLMYYRLQGRIIT